MVNDTHTRRRRQEFTENECEALPGVAYPGVRDNRSTINTKTGYDDDDESINVLLSIAALNAVLNKHSDIIKQNEMTGK